MSGQFSGFEKSAPQNLPGGRSRKQPVSSWDMDLTPFEKLLDSHTSSTRQLSESFVKATEELSYKLSEDRDNASKRLERHQEEMAYQLKQLHQTSKELSQQLKQMHEDFTNMFAKVIHHCERTANSLEQVENSQAKLNNVSQTGKEKFDLRETVLFWGFAGILLLFFLLFFLLPRLS